MAKLKATSRGAPLSSHISVDRFQKAGRCLLHTYSEHMTEEQTTTTKRSMEEEVQHIQQALAKKPKIEENDEATQSTAPTAEAASSEPPRKVLHPNPLPVPVSKMGLKPAMPDLPPSLALITGITPDFIARKGFVGEQEVGIIGYAGPKDVKGVRGVIKQR